MTAIIPLPHLHHEDGTRSFMGEPLVPKVLGCSECFPVRPATAPRPKGCHLELSSGRKDGYLIFMPHSNGSEATFDVCGRLAGDSRLPPEYTTGVTRLFNNLTRDEAGVLRDALNEWLTS